MMPRNLIKWLQNIFKCPNNTFESAGFINLGAQLILPQKLLKTLSNEKFGYKILMKLKTYIIVELGQKEK